MRSGRFGRVLSVAMLAALAIVAGVLTALAPSAAAAVCAVIVLAAVLTSTHAVRAPVDLRDKQFRWVLFAWAYVLIRPIGHLSGARTSLAAVAGVPSWENVVDVGVHAAIAALALWSLRINRFELRPPVLILGLPLMALVSAAWSLAPTTTLGFSFELVVICLLAMLTAAIYRVDPDRGRMIVGRTLRVIVLLVALLCIVGLLFPNGPGSTPGDTRFHWPGEHPLVATAEIGFALLTLVFARRDEIGFARPTRVVLMVLFAICLYLGQSRTAFAGLIAAGLFGYWFITRGRGWAGRLAGAAAIGLVIVLIIGSFGGVITQYLYRGQSQQQVFGLNGRLGLWTVAVDQLHTPGQWLFGYGLSSSRLLLAGNVAWAGDAHGAWIELLVSLGLVGLALGVVLVATLAVRLFRRAPAAPSPSRVLPILFIYVLAMSPAATGFAAPGPEPGLGFALLAFCYAPTAVRLRARSRAPASRGGRFTGDLRPVPT